jgi:hypothetical protein
MNQYLDPPPIWPIRAADFAVVSKTTKLRLSAQALFNEVAPAINFTFGLYPITVGGDNDEVGTEFFYDTGTVVAGSTVAVSAPAADTVTLGVGSDFDLPANGAYVVAVVTSAQMATDSMGAVQAQLQVRNV